MALMNALETAQYLGVHKTTFFRWVRDGNAPSPVMIGTKRWYTKESVDAWVRGNQVQEGRK